jgi:tRNA pseudouridine38-40 synthase
LERALGKTCGHAVKAVGCGANGRGRARPSYCANFRTESAIPLERLPLAVNSRLPPDIAVWDAVTAPEEFNAIGFLYSKRVCLPHPEQPYPRSVSGKAVCFYPAELDIGRMRRAASAFEGTHDFAPSGASAPKQKARCARAMVPRRKGRRANRNTGLRGRFFI